MSPSTRPSARPPARPPAPPSSAPVPGTAGLARRHHDGPLGRFTIVASEAGLRALLFPDEREGRVVLDLTPGDGVDPTATERQRAHLDAAARQLDEYFERRRTTFDVALDPVGTPFQRAAWMALREIPYGETRSYGQQAVALGSPTAVRAVGAANGRNPISIIVPCHRVVGADGSLTGYAGGMDRKRFLLELEAGQPALF